MAAVLEANIRLHDHGAVTVGAFHVLIWNYSTSVRNDVNAAADVGSSAKNIFMLVFYSDIEALLEHKLLPFVKVLHHLHDSCPRTTEHHIRSFAEYSPSTLIFVG